MIAQLVLLFVLSEILDHQSNQNEIKVNTYHLMADYEPSKYQHSGSSPSTNESRQISGDYLPPMQNQQTKKLTFVSPS